MDYLASWLGGKQVKEEKREDKEDEKGKEEDNQEGKEEEKGTEENKKLEEEKEEKQFSSLEKQYLFAQQRSNAKSAILAEIKQNILLGNLVVNELTEKVIAANEDLQASIERTEEARTKYHEAHLTLNKAKTHLEKLENKLNEGKIAFDEACDAEKKLSLQCEAAKQK